MSLLVQKSVNRAILAIAEEYFHLFDIRAHVNRDLINSN